MDNLPDSAELSPASILSNYVLPEPLAPETLSISPEFSSNERLLKSSLYPFWQVKSLTINFDMTSF